MRIIIDGDACPVKQEAIEIGQNYQIPIIIITTFAHYNFPEKQEGVTYKFLDSENQMADYYIFGMVEVGDIVITQDYGLASLLLDRARVLHHMGQEYTINNINMLLQERHLNQQSRNAGQRQTRIKPLSEVDNKNFSKQLIKMIQENKE